MGPCRTCGRAGGFGFNPMLARIRAAAGPLWVCADHRAGLPHKGQGGHEMDALQDFLECEQEDMAAAAAAMARHWKAQGLGAQVAAIGREQGFEGAKVLLGTYFELRARRLKAERDEADENAIPY